MITHEMTFASDLLDAARRLFDPDRLRGLNPFATPPRIYVDPRLASGSWHFGAPVEGPLLPGQRHPDGPVIPNNISAADVKRSGVAIMITGSAPMPVITVDPEAFPQMLRATDAEPWSILHTQAFDPGVLIAVSPVGLHWRSFLVQRCEAIAGGMHLLAIVPRSASKTV